MFLENQTNVLQTGMIANICCAFVFCSFAGSAFALDKPIQSRYDGRLLSTHYNASDVYPINAVNGIVSTIVFGEDEIVQAHSSGFSTAWEFASRGNKFFLKPKTDGAGTNLVIVTNKHIYHFDLRLTTSRKTATYQLVFDYPEIAKKISEEKALEAEVREKLNQSPIGEQPIASGTEAVKNRNYTMNFGKSTMSKTIAPAEAFDDGRFTYLRFKEQADFPSVYRVIEDEETLVNSHVEGQWLVIHGVYKSLRLRAGKAVVGVYNESFTGGGKLSTTGVTVDGLERTMIGE